MVGQIIVTNKLADKINLPLRPHITIKAGVRTIKTQLEISYNTTESYNLSSQLAQALLLKPGQKLQIRYDKSLDLLHIGPTIGILTSVVPARGEFSASSTQAELMYLSNIGRNLNAQVYVFTPNSIDWENQSTRGYVYKPSTDKFGIWESSTYPLPDVVYDRIPSRKAEARALIKMTKRRLMNLPNLKYFNPSFFNKLRVYEMLTTNHSLLPYLPETRPLNQVNLQAMLDRHRVLYIKPANGSLGRGIIKTYSKGDGKIHFAIYKNGRQHGSAENAAQFLDKTKSFHHKKMYLVQQGIELAKYENSAFDIRIIYQKNSEGKWTISKKFIRVAARGSSISNLSKGGRVEQSKTVLGQVLNWNKNLIKAKNNELKYLCEAVATTMEKSSLSILGELGLDIGIDYQGRLWLIEVNSKPRKTTETEMSQKIVHNTFKRPLEYGVYLAGFSNAKKLGVSDGLI